MRTVHIRKTLVDNNAGKVVIALGEHGYHVLALVDRGREHPAEPFIKSFARSEQKQAWKLACGWADQVEDENWRRQMALAGEW